MKMYKTTAHDPEVGAARVYAIANHPAQAKIDCYRELCKYLQSSPRWVGAGEFTIDTQEVKE